MRLQQATKLLRTIIAKHQTPVPPCLAFGTKKQNRKQIKKHRKKYGEGFAILCITTTNRRSTASLPDEPTPTTTKADNDSATPNRPLILDI